MALRRDAYLGLFAHLFGYTPAQVDDLSVRDFEQLAAWADDHNRQQEAS